MYFCSAGQLLGYRIDNATDKKHLNLPYSCVNQRGCHLAMTLGQAFHCLLHPTSPKMERGSSWVTSQWHCQPLWQVCRCLVSLDASLLTPGAPDAATSLKKRRQDSEVVEIIEEIWLIFTSPASPDPKELWLAQPFQKFLGFLPTIVLRDATTVKELPSVFSNSPTCIPWKLCFQRNLAWYSMLEFEPD